MKKILIAGVSAACIVSNNSASAAKLVQVSFRHLDLSTIAGKCRSNDISLIDDKKGEYICAITGVGGHFDGGGEHGAVLKVKTLWHLSGNACQPGVFFEATCWGIQ